MAGVLVWTLRLLVLCTTLLLVAQWSRAHDRREQVAGAREIVMAEYDALYQQLREQLVRKHEEDDKQFRRAVKEREPVCSMAKVADHEKSGTVRRVN